MFKKIKTSLFSKRTVYLLVIAGMILLLYFIIKSCSSKLDLVYEYDNISIGEVSKTISVTGKLEVVNDHVIVSRIGGVVNRIYADFNDRVHKNQLLATFDSMEIENNILLMERALERAKLDLVEVKNALTGKNELLREKLISKKELEMAEINYQKVLSVFKQKKLEFDIAIQKRNDLRVTAPASGVIISREIEENRPYAANKILFVMAESLKKMRLMINVDESDIGNIQTGQEVNFTVSAYPEKIFSGTISQVRMEPITSGAIVSYQSVVRCDNNELFLKPGMTATATILIGRKKNTLRVLNQAFLVNPLKEEPEAGKKFVWKKRLTIVEEIPVEKVEVVTGITGDQYTEIVSGNIKDGDRILVGIHKKLAVKDELSSYGK